MAKRKKKPGKDGRPSKLTNKLLGKLRVAILRGDTVDKMATDNKISVLTIYNWKYENYEGFAEKWDIWKRQRLLALAERNIDEFLEMDTYNTKVTEDGDEITFKDSGLVRVKADITKFTSETLGKDAYSKRNELTGEGGKDLIPNPAEKQKAEHVIDAFLDSGDSR